MLRVIVEKVILMVLLPQHKDNYNKLDMLILVQGLVNIIINGLIKQLKKVYFFNQRKQRLNLKKDKQK